MALTPQSQTEGLKVDPVLRQTQYPELAEGSGAKPHLQSQGLAPSNESRYTPLTFALHIYIVIAHIIHYGETMEYLVALDRKVFLWINNQWSLPPLDFFFSYFITWLGNAGVVIALVGIFFALKKPSYFREHFFWFLAAMLLAGLCVLVLKKMISRPRPLTDFAPLIETGTVHIHVLGAALKYRSFPSGDTQTAFTAATYLSLLLPRWTPLFIFLAVGVGLSRIYRGVHFPLDVIIGGLIGAVFASGAWLVRKKVLKPPSAA
jgi:undecaprenyl-diphosphatase